MLFFLCFILGVSCHAAFSQPAGKIAVVECIEYPGKDPGIWNALYAARDGMVYTGLCTHAGSAHFYQYDPGARVHRNLYDIAEFLGEKGQGIRTTGKIHTAIVPDGEGNLYFGTLNAAAGPHNIDYTSWRGGHWLRFDTKSRTLVDLGLVARGIGLYTINIDPRRRFLFGLGFTGYLYRFDIDRGETTNLGRVSNWDICRNLVIDDRGNVYGCFPSGRDFASPGPGLGALRYRQASAGRSARPRLPPDQRGPGKQQRHHFAADRRQWQDLRRHVWRAGVPLPV